MYLYVYVQDVPRLHVIFKTIQDVKTICFRAKFRERNRSIECTMSNTIRVNYFRCRGNGLKFKFNCVFLPISWDTLYTYTYYNTHTEKF